MESRRLTGVVAIVTGAAQGIGEGVALRFGTEGAAVVLADVNDEGLERVSARVRERGADAISVRCDVGERAEIAACVQTAVDRFGRLDVLVNVAIAHTERAPLEAETLDDIERRWKVDYFGTLHFMREAFPHLRGRGGSIINFGSGAGLEGSALLGQYVATKEAIRAISRLAAREWGRYGIRANVIVPFASSPSQQRLAQDDPELMDALVARTALGRVGDPEMDIGRAAVFLASEESSYVTGATLMVDGGKLIH